MVRLESFVAATALAVATLASAQAADLLPPPPALDGPLRGSIVADSGFYVRGDVGVGLNTTAKGSSTITNSGAPYAPPHLSYDETTISDGVILGGGFGYRFNNFFRADITGEYHGGGTWRSRESYDDTPGANTSCVGQADVNAAPARCSDLYKASIDHGLFLANGYVDLWSFGSVTPYLGVGLGTAYNRIGRISDTAGTSATSVEYSNAVSRWNFAWALMAGASVNIARGLDLDLSYRYVDMGKMDGGTTYCTGTCGLSEIQHYKFASHDFRVGLRYAFGDVAPAPVVMGAPTLVRRY